MVAKFQVRTAQSEHDGIGQQYTRSIELTRAVARFIVVHIGGKDGLQCMVAVLVVRLDNGVQVSEAGFIAPHFVIKEVHLARTCYL